MGLKLFGPWINTVDAVNVWSTHLGLTGHLKRHFPHMYRLYVSLTKRNTPPTVLELQLASGKAPLSPDDARAYIANLEKKAQELTDFLDSAVRDMP